MALRSLLTSPSALKNQIAWDRLVIHRLLVLSFICIALTWLATGSACGAQANATAQTTPAAAQFGVNLIVNGDAEAGKGASSTGDDLVDIPGWTRQGNLQVMQYGASGGDLSLTDPGPKNRGMNYFAGGNSNEESSATQTIDISALASDISKGNVSYKFSAWLGGYESQNDHTYITASFEDNAGKVLKVAALGPVMAVDRHNVTELVPRSTAGLVPSGSASVVILMKMVRTDGSYNDGLADNLSLVFHK